MQSLTTFLQKRIFLQRIKSFCTSKTIRPGDTLPHEHTYYIANNIGSHYLPQNMSILVTCCNKHGAIFKVDFHEKSYAISKVYPGEARGIGHCSEGYVFCNSSAILKLDNDFKIIQKKNVSKIGCHGLCAYNWHIYVVETLKNTIGIFDGNTLDRVDEINFPVTGRDYNHINDICIVDDYLYVSMFSHDEAWRERNGTNGVLMKISLTDHSAREVLFSGLNNPHSVTYWEDSVYLCQSGLFTVEVGGQRLFTASGYLRGLAFAEDFMFIGQSASRNVLFSRGTHPYISMNPGLHIVYTKDCITYFIPLPANEVYGILPIDSKSSRPI